MTRANAPAFPVPTQGHGYGLTIREHFALHILNGLLAGNGRPPSQCPAIAVELADDLLAKLAPTDEMPPLTVDTDELLVQARRQETCRTHCCREHGCKYAYPNCPVACGWIEQAWPCEYCEWPEEEP